MSEERVGFYTMIEEHLAVPFDVELLGVTVTVERIEMTNDGCVPELVDFQVMPHVAPHHAAGETTCIFGCSAFTSKGSLS